MSSSRLRADAVTDLVGRVRHEVDKGALPAAQVAVAIDGELAVFETFGESSPGVPATDSTRFTFFSTTKPLVASAIWLALAEAGIGYDTPVSSLFPAFADNGKEAVTIEQLLIHTAGFPSAPMGPAVWTDRASRQQKMASWRLNYEPGTQCAYHASSAHWVLAELLDEVTGVDFRDYVEQRVTGPLGLRRLLGISPEDQQDIALVTQVGTAPTGAELEEILGQPAGSLGDGPIEIPREMDEATLLRYNEPGQRTVGVPGAGGIGTAADLAMVYQGFLRNPDGLWPDDVLNDALTNVRTSLVDSMRQVPANRTAGLILAGDDGGATRRGFGKGNSPMSFGHDGVGGQLAWADPATGLSFCFVGSGLERNVILEGRRSYGINQRASTVVS